MTNDEHRADFFERHTILDLSAIDEVGFAFSDLGRRFKTRQQAEAYINERYLLECEMSKREDELAAKYGAFK